MTVRRTLAGLSIVFVLTASSATAMAAGRPHGMTSGAYRALEAQSQALNARYGNAVTRLSPKQFIELYRAGGSKLTPQALNALVVRSEGLNRRYHLSKPSYLDDLDPAIRTAVLAHTASIAQQQKNWVSERTASGAAQAQVLPTPSSGGDFGWLDAAIGGFTVAGLLLLGVSIQSVHRALRHPHSL